LRQPRHTQACRRQLDAAANAIGLHQGFRPGIDGNRNAEGLGDAVGRDVVMGRSYAARREHVVVAMAQSVHRRNDVLFVIGNNPHLFQADADSGQMAGDGADVLVLGPAGQDLVADHQNARGDDLAHGLSSPSVVTLRKQRLEVTGFCCRNKHRPAVF